MPIVHESRSKSLNLSEGDLEFLQKFAQEDIHYMNFAEFKNVKQFKDPIPDIVPDITWFYNLMGTLALGKSIAIASPKQRLLTREEEYEMFRLYNSYRYNIRQAQKKWKKQGKPALTAKQIRALLSYNEKALKVEERIASFNLGLIIAMSRRVMGTMSLTDLSDFISDGGFAMIRSIRKFDATKGYKFSTYFCRAAIKQMWRELQKRIKISNREINSTRLGGSSDEDDKNFSSNRAFVSADTIFLEQLTKERIGIIAKVFSNKIDIYIPDKFKLTDNEIFVLKMRYLNSKNDKQPILTDIAQSMSDDGRRPDCDKPYTKERIRQILQSGLNKIRAIIEEYETPTSERVTICKIDHFGTDTPEPIETLEKVPTVEELNFQPLKHRHVLD